MLNKDGGMVNNEPTENQRVSMLTSLAQVQCIQPGRRLVSANYLIIVIQNEPQIT